MRQPPTSLVIIATGSQGEPRAALAKLAARSNPHVWLEPGDEVVLSARVIPGRELDVHGLVNEFERAGIRVWQRHDDPELHVSGHACREEQRRMLSLVRPQSFIPVHGTFRHLTKHAKLAHEMGVQDTLVMLNGDCVELTERDVKIVDQWPVGRAHVQGGKAVSDQALRDRCLLAEVGIAVVSVHVTRDGSLVGTPRLMTRGLFVEDDHGDVTDEVIAEVEDAIERLPPHTTDEALQQSACTALRKKLGAHLGYRPYVYALVTRAGT
jgi:ribonuclease J